MRLHMYGHKWRSEDNLSELILSYHHAGLREQTQAIKLGSKCFYLLSHLTGLTVTSLKDK